MSGSENHDGHTSKRTCFLEHPMSHEILEVPQREIQNALDLT